MTGTEGKTYTNGLTLYPKFSDKALQGTGTYYLTLDAFAGKVNGQSIVNITSKSTEFKTVDLTKYTPVREGFTFKGWELDGKFVTSIDSSYFANRDCITLTATYTQDILETICHFLGMNFKLCSRTAAAVRELGSLAVSRSCFGYSLSHLRTAAACLSRCIRHWRRSKAKPLRGSRGGYRRRPQI